MGTRVPTHYDTLGVARHASPRQVRTAYRRKAQTCHPDKLADQALAQKLMSQVNRAYAVLSDAAGRAAYDRWLDAHDSLLAAQRAVHEAAHPSRFSASWPWYLLSATIAFALLTVGTVLYKEAVPSVAAPLPAAQPAAANPAAPAMGTGPAAAAPGPQTP